jgi:hypothetical protein
MSVGIASVLDLHWQAFEAWRVSVPAVEVLA